MPLLERFLTWLRPPTLPVDTHRVMDLPGGGQLHYDGEAFPDGLAEDAFIDQLVRSLDEPLPYAVPIPAAAAQPRQVQLPAFTSATRTTSRTGGRRPHWWVDDELVAADDRHLHVVRDLQPMPELALLGVPYVLDDEHEVGNRYRLAVRKAEWLDKIATDPWYFTITDTWDGHRLLTGNVAPTWPAALALGLAALDEHYAGHELLEQTT